MLAYYKKVGDVRAYSSQEIEFSRMGVGFEKLDREVFDPNKAYDKVAALGVKWVRLQSGWQRTEKVPGKYDFRWLDEVVDNLLQRKLVPWVCLCYGNCLYDEEAAQRFGGVGCPPTKTPEQKQAWHDYVVATVRHFEGRVDWWEIWNEPDCYYSWRNKCSAKEYAPFAIDTAKAIREGSAQAKIIGGAFCSPRVEFTKPCLDLGMGDYCDAISFHIYSSNEADHWENVSNMKRILKRYNPNLKLIQGESGCQSRCDGSGALAGQAWTEEKQAKSLARHQVSYLAQDVMFSSYFSTMDMIEALNGRVGDKASYMDYGYFGVLGADFDENGISTGEYTPKPSYRALQVISSLFRGEFTVEELIAISNPRGYLHNNRYADGECYLSELSHYSFRRANGAAAFVYWKPTSLLRESFESMTSLAFMGVPAGIPKLIDLVDGSVYEINEKDVVYNHDDGWKECNEPYLPPKMDGTDSILIKNLPVLDRPIMLDFGGFGD